MHRINTTALWAGLTGLTFTGIFNLRHRVYSEPNAAKKEWYMNLTAKSDVDEKHAHTIGRQKVRLSMMTLNMWVENGVPGGDCPRRYNTIRQLLERFDPDVLCVQEAHPCLQHIVKEALPTHDFVQGEEKGWANEGNLYWNRKKLSMLQCGAEDFHNPKKNRKLFWTRLQLNESGSEGLKQRTILVSTAHLSWPGGKTEENHAINVRMVESQHIVNALQKLRDCEYDTHYRSLLGEPMFLLGDFNESYHPEKIFRRDGNLISCFRALGLTASSTHPCRPSTPREDLRADEVCDWIFAGGAARPLLASVIKFQAENKNEHHLTLPYASDHFPVCAIYEIDI